VQQRLSLHLDDLCANFMGEPGYERTPAILTFGGVTAFATDISPADGRRCIYTIELDEAPEHLRIRVRCWPGGNLDLTCKRISIINKTLQSGA